MWNVTTAWAWRALRREQRGADPEIRVTITAGEALTTCGV